MGNILYHDGRNKNYGNYSTDEFNVYWKRIKIPEATSQSFRYLGNDYGKDEFDVFYKGKILKGIDTDNFKLEEYIKRK